LASKLKLLIVDQFGTQEKFAAQTGLREDRLSKIVREIKEPTDAEKLIISTALQTEPEVIFGGRE